MNDVRKRLSLMLIYEMPSHTWPTIILVPELSRKGHLRRFPKFITKPVFVIWPTSFMHELSEGRQIFSEFPRSSRGHVGKASSVLLQPTGKSVVHRTERKMSK